MRSLRSFLLFSVSAALLTGCETTGNPREGGIFWSPDKAQSRLDRRERTLDEIDADTDRISRRNRRMENRLGE